MQKQFDVVLSNLLKQNNISPDGAFFTLAVSGGIDSMCLAQLCLESALDLHFQVAHCNFHLRGDQSDGDEAFVVKWCSDNGVKVLVKGFDTISFASSHSISIEMAARELRYKWFAEIDGLSAKIFARHYGSRMSLKPSQTLFAAKPVLVAHNANDNAETMLLNLVRGTGLKGLCGMAASAQNPYGEGLLMRPLLGFTRKQIEGYARSKGLSWREDSTNACSDYKRNFLRNEVLPLLEKLNPSVVKTLNREARYFTDAFKTLDCCYEPLIHSNRIDIGLVVRDPYLLYSFLEKYGFNSSTIDSVYDLINSERTISGKVFSSPTHTLVTTSSELIISDQQMTRQGEVQRVDADKLPEGYVIRPWQQGDWMRPLGMGGRRKKLSDIFGDLKFNALEKQSARVLAAPDSSEVLVLLGHRISETVKITPSTTNVVEIPM